MPDDLVTRLLPILLQQSEADFNVFDVMRHGTHERQLSNVFAWLLDAEGTHMLGDAFQNIFIDEVNRGLRVRDRGPIARGGYSVRQEVNTSDSADSMDIADLVLEADSTVLVIENYYTSDGHGHSFDGYWNFGARGGKKRSEVVMLCGSLNAADLRDGWENAAVVTYPSLVAQLMSYVEGNELYKEAYPSQWAFFGQMSKHFVKGRRMDDSNLIEFIGLMCKEGQANSYRQSLESGAVTFADMLRERALKQFVESRELLQRLKASLKTYCAGPLRDQVNASFEEARIVEVSANYQGIYQWTINFTLAGEEAGSEGALQLKFGPSAWYANEKDVHWKTRVVGADYSHIFVTRTLNKEVRQSAVTLQDVLDGIALSDLRLRDEIVNLLKDRA